MTITREQRFTPSHPCPICGGYDGLPRGQQRRCAGFLSDDGEFAHCTREEFAGNLMPTNASPPTFPHRRTGNCKCGQTHDYSVGRNNGARRSSDSSQTRVVKTYDYRDANGDLLFQVARTDPKGFFQRRPDGDGGWIPNLKGVRRILYRLPELRAADASEPVFVCEGERDVERLRQEGLVATTNPGGAGKWRKEYSAELGGRLVVLLPDNDRAGREHAAKVASALTGVATRVAVLALAGLSKGQDVSDWFDTGHTVIELKRLAEEAPPWRARFSNTGSGVGRPEIIIRTDIQGVVDDTVWALAQSDQEVFKRANVLVRVIRDTGRPGLGITRPPGAAVIAPVPDAALREIVSRCARWKKSSDGVKKAALPPVWAVKALSERADWPLRYLEGIVEAPCLRPDGSILDSPGYDTETGLLYEPGPGAFPRVPATPKRDEALAALAELKEVIRDFPFVADSPGQGSPSRSAALAAMLTPFARHALIGQVPLFAVRAPTPGTGKSLFVDVVSLLLTGRCAARMVQGGSDAEERKRILAIGLEGSPLILIDNVEGLLGSPALAAALTAETFSDRWLGANRTVTVRLSAVWFATGNNLAFRGDLFRRVVPIDLDANCEIPEQRSQFAHSPLLPWVRAERPRLVCAILTVLRAFVVAGQPQPTPAMPEFGSFEPWSRLIRAALVWLGEPDPNLTRVELRETSEPELEQLGAALEQWHRVFGEEPWTLAEAVKRGDDDEELKSALGGLQKKFDGKLNAKSLGYRFRDFNRRIIRGLQLVRAESREGSGARWLVRRIVPSCADGVDDADDSTRGRFQ